MNLLIPFITGAISYIAIRKAMQLNRFRKDYEIKFRNPFRKDDREEIADLLMGKKKPSKIERFVKIRKREKEKGTTLPHYPLPQVMQMAGGHIHTIPYHTHNIHSHSISPIPFPPPPTPRNISKIDVSSLEHSEVEELFELVKQLRENHEKEESPETYKCCDECDWCPQMPLAELKEWVENGGGGGRIIPDIVAKHGYRYICYDCEKDPEAQQAFEKQVKQRNYELSTSCKKMMTKLDDVL